MVTMQSSQSGATFKVVPLPKEVIKMLKFTMEHKYTKMLRVISGENIAQALKNSNTDVNYWTCVDVMEVK